MRVSELQAASMGKNSQDHKYLYMLIMFLQVHGHDKNHWFEIQNSIKIKEVPVHHHAMNVAAALQA